MHYRCSVTCHSRNCSISRAWSYLIHVYINMDKLTGTCWRTSLNPRHGTILQRDALTHEFATHVGHAPRRGCSSLYVCVPIHYMSVLNVGLHPIPLYTKITQVDTHNHTHRTHLKWSLYQDHSLITKATLTQLKPHVSPYAEELDYSDDISLKFSPTLVLTLKFSFSQRPHLLVQKTSRS